jgi:hypothetical protein
MKKIKEAFKTGYTDEQYQEALKGFFKDLEIYELQSRGIDFLDYKDSIFYFKSSTNDRR